MVVTTDELKEVTVLVMDASYPEQVFGILVGDQKIALTQIYKSLTLKCYPDLFPDNQKLATSTFQELGRWKEYALKKIEAGTYGDNKPYVPPVPYTPLKFKIDGEDLECVELLGKGTLSSVHLVKGKVPWSRQVLKVARSPKNNDLLDREYRILSLIFNPDSDPGREKFFSIQRNYVPEPKASFLIAGRDSKKHRANLLSVKEARTFTAEQLREDKFPDGIEAKHLYWIYRRALITMWMAHLHGYVYGNFTPDHLLVYPKEHGLVLLDWTAATKIGTKVPVISDRWMDFYPEEVKKGQPATPATDLYMAAKMFGYLGKASDIPVSVQACVTRCLARAGRPEDANKFHDEFGRAIELAHGPRTYVEFVVP